MKTIRIDDDVWAKLQKRAKAFEDTPNSVLRRLLHLSANTSSNRRRTTGNRAPTGAKTPQAKYREPILRALYESGGSATVEAVLHKVEALMGHRLNQIDRGSLASGEVRWRNTAQWERTRMVDDGLLKRNSQRGLWELTGKGIAAVERILGR